MKFNLKWSSVDDAWMAGFWEGEGYITVNKNSLFLGANQINKEPLEKLMRIVGSGSVYGPRTTKSKLSRQPIYEYMAWNFESVQQALIRMWPHLSSRRKDQIKLKMGSFTERWAGGKHR